MQAAILFYLASRVFSALMGGAAVFCLYYAGKVSDPNTVGSLLINALIWGGCAATIVYFQGKYLNNKF
jgi:hypothetical protein